MAISPKDAKVFKQSEIDWISTKEEYIDRDLEAQYIGQPMTITTAYDMPTARCVDELKSRYKIKGWVVKDSHKTDGPLKLEFSEYEPNFR